MTRTGQALLLFVWLASASACCVFAPARPPAPPDSAASLVDRDLARFVDPFIGTGESDVVGAPSGDLGGAVFPGATVPFGMIQWSPDTAPAAEFSYRYRDDRIKGFSVNHLSGPGCPALLDFPFLPTTVVPTRSPALDRVAYEGAFSHDTEVASPGYYAVHFKSGIEVNLTAQTRAGFARFTYPGGAAAGLLLEAGKSVADGNTNVNSGELHVVGLRRINAALSSADFCHHKSSYRVYLAAAFDHEIAEASAYQKDVWRPGARDAEGPRAGLYLRFDTQGGATVGVTVAISYVSAQNANLNLEAALRAKSFEAVRAEARKTWNHVLAKIQVRGGSAQDTRKFYTALYHTLLHPNVSSDVNGEYRGFDNQVHTEVGYTHYANYSGWDIYRSWIQLVALIAPHEATDIVRSLIVDAQQCGGLPRWTLANDETGVMVGDPGALLVANAWAFGVRGFDASAALALMKQGAALPETRCNGYEIRPGRRAYNELGYLPTDAPEAGWGPTSTTLEYAAADFGIAQYARQQGDAATAELFQRRSRNWRNLYNPKTGYIQPRLRNGEWKAEFDPSSVDSYVEGNAAQYTFFVPHDVPALAQALGGNQAAIARLDALFAQLNGGINKPYFYIGNEPEFGTPWLYDYLGAPWKTQEVVRKIVTRAFGDQPGGLPGNDDLGATSSWLVWANLGLYPDVPGVGGFALGSPLFRSVSLALPDGEQLELDAPDAAADHPYVQSLEVDGHAWNSPWLPLAELMRGARLRFRLGAQPAEAWGQVAPPRYFGP